MTPPWDPAREKCYHGFWYPLSYCRECMVEERRKEIEADMPVMIQDEHALAEIDNNAPLLAYPLLNADRVKANIGKLVVYIFRLLWWRFRSRALERAARRNAESP